VVVVVSPEAAPEKSGAAFALGKAKLVRHGGLATV
jgi:hypothetical protein